MFIYWKYLPQKYAKIFLNFTGGQWVGNFSKNNCTDPKVLSKNLQPNIEDLRIEEIRIKTFERRIYLNSTLATKVLQWNTIPFELGTCFEMTLPDDIKDKG